MFAQAQNDYALGVEGQPLWYIDGLDLRPNINITAPAGRRKINPIWLLLGLGLLIWWLIR